jgi:hypothetical protein
MDNDLEHQIELVKNLINNLNDYTSQINRSLKKYEDHINYLEKNGLASNMVKRLRKKYLLNTEVRYQNFIKLIQNKDIPEAENIIKGIQSIIDTMDN